MKTAAQRIAHYEARMVSSLIDPVLAAVNATAVENFTTHAIDFVPKQEKLRIILDAAGVATTLIPAYEAFHGKLFHLFKTVTGASLTAAATYLVAQYKAPAMLGAGAEATLKKIALDIYGVTVP